MANIIQTPGSNVILDQATTTLGAGSGFQVMPKIGNLTFMALISGTSAGVTVTGTLNVDVSNDGTNFVAAVGTTMTINGVTPQAAIGVIASSLNGGWAYVRANLTAASSTTTASTGYRVRVYASGLDRAL